MKRFAFLQCGHCRHFQSKKAVPVPMGAQKWGAAFHTGAVVGMCLAGDRPEWLVWKSLEFAVSNAGSCFERAPEHSASDTRPRCTNYDFTAETGTQAYPNDCVYYGKPNCPLSQRRSV